MMPAALPDWLHRDATRTEQLFRARHRGNAERRVRRLPPSFQGYVLDGWDNRYGIAYSDRNRSPVALANQFAVEVAQDFGDGRAGLAYDEHAIAEHADNYARLCARMRTLDKRVEFAASLGVAPPAGPRVTPAGAIARLNDPKWWRRQLRQVWTERCEEGMRRAGIVRKGRAPYASDEAVRHRANRQRRTREWMESRVMVNGEGEQLALLDLHERSVANPALRRGEFMTRMRGFEEIARDLGHVALFFTLTAPSAFHAQHAGGGTNERWEAADKPRVRDAQRWLRRMWAKARAKLHRLSIDAYGFRVAEPHHDATPHWHMVLFVAASGADALARVLRGYWLSEFADEPGATEHRAACKVIDPEQGSATGYVAKYVAKNIDAAGAIGDAISDETGEAVSAGVQRVAAWASVYRIRQFQQIGGPPVGLWRELRRAREPVEAQNLERVRVAVDKGQWAGFITTLGGLKRSRRRVRSVRHKYRRECVVTPANAHEYPAAWLDKRDATRIDLQGREVTASTVYGEPAGRKPCGVVALGLLGRWASVETRRQRWRIARSENTKKGAVPVVNPQGTGETGADRPAASDSFSGARSALCSDLGPVAITVRSGSCGCADCSTGQFAPYRPERHQCRAGP